MKKEYSGGGTEVPVSEAVREALEQCPGLRVEVTPYGNREKRGGSDGREYAVEFFWPRENGAGGGKEEDMMMTSARKITAAAEKIIGALSFLKNPGPLSWNERGIGLAGTGHGKTNRAGEIVPASRTFMFLTDENLRELNAALADLTKNR